MDLILKNGDDSNSNDEMETPRDSCKQKNSPNRVNYKQKYRKVWEQLPEFNCWLEPDPKNTARAFCKVCNKYLHAHRLTLLKHTASIKHMKCAKIMFEKKSILKQRLLESKKKDDVPGEETPKGSVRTDVIKENRELPVDSNSSLNNSADKHDGVDDRIPEQVDDAQLISTVQDDVCDESTSINKSNHPTTNDSASPPPAVVKPPITTHVLDTSKGIPVPGLPVVLYKLVGGRWTYISEGFTNPDGRCTNLISRDDLEPGRFKLHFDTDKYFELRKNDRMYPFIEIVFDIYSPTEHVHLPLLMSPYGYTTYKGS